MIGKNKATPLPQLNEREQEILKQLESGLSDQEIAAQLHLSLNTVKWYNRQIYGKLGVSSRTQAIASAKDLGLLDRAVAKFTVSIMRHNLPAQTTPFIGRTREIEEVKQLLHTYRLLTLTGTGGTGKTRLALQVAAEVVDAFADGVYFVDLAPLSRSDLVANAVAGMLGIVENSTEPLLDTLKRAIAQRELLLLVDNFEHIIMAAPMLSTLLASCPRLKILVTSRESLHITGEQEYPVPPLTLPTADTISAHNLADSEAGALFVQRAQMTWPHFEVSDTSVESIVQICNRLDGLPLAIELAAARCKLLTPQDLLKRLDGEQEGFPLGTLASGSRDAPPRHRTLRDTMAWSYNLLDNDEKRLFERMAVFRGGRSLDAVSTVCGENLSLDVLEGLSSLVDKSLVQQKEASTGELRFSFLEMIHEYARERLAASGEAEAIRKRHADYFVELAEHAEPELRLELYDYWCQRFELELDNIRVVLEWSLNDGDLTLGVRLASALGLFWYGKGHHVEGIEWTQQFLKRLDEVPVVYHAQFLMSAGHMAWMYDLDMAQPLFKRALDISRTLGDTLNTAWALTFLGYTMQRDPEAAMPVAEEGLSLFRELKHLPGIAQTLNIIGEIARLGGDHLRAKNVYEECLEICQPTGEARRICYLCYNLAYIAQHEGDHARAIDLGRQSLQLALDRNDRYDLAAGLVILAGSIGMMGQLPRAARLLGAIDAAFERMGAFHQPSDQPEIDRITAIVRAQLDEAAFLTLWTEGHQMPLEQAVMEALD